MNKSIKDMTDIELRAYKKMIDHNVSKFDNMQMAKKILLNSAYGALGNAGFRYFDIRIAEAITLSGQLSIKWIANRINKYLNKIIQTENVDYIIAIDTDSNYIELSHLVKKGFPNGASTETIVKSLSKFCSDMLEPHIHEQYDSLAKYMNAFENKMVMEREVIAERGFWTSKKRYVLNVWDSEGVSYAEPKLKVIGLESKKSSTPEICRKKLKELYLLAVTKDESAVQKFIADFRSEWNTLSVDQIASPISCNNLEKYSDVGTIFIKGTPRHVKGALTHNHIVQTKNLSSMIELIGDGDKVKCVPLKVPNPASTDVISFSGHLRDELGLTKYVDYKAQFEKAFLSPVRIVLTAVGWTETKQVSLKNFLKIG